MGRGLFTLGCVLLVATIGLWIAGAVDWLPENFDNHLAALTLKVGLVLILASLVFRAVTPVTKRMAKGRCQVCGAATDRGHAYCLDHLQEMVNTHRDRTHELNSTGSRRRG